MSTAQLCKFEKGVHLPHADFLQKIELGLDLPRKSLVSIRNRIAKDACYDDGEHFDDLSARFVPTYDGKLSIPEEGLRRLIAEIEPRVDDYTFLLDRLNLPSFCLVDLGKPLTSSMQNGIDYAEELRKFLADETAPFAALLPRLEQHNIRIIPMPTLPPIDQDGKHKMRVALAFHDRRCDCPVIAVNEQAPSHSQLYEIAYEIGSYFRHDRHQTLQSRHPAKEWVFCRAFAATLLIPTTVIRDIVNLLYISPRKWELPLVDALAQRFGVSSMAMLYRLDSIGAIDKKLCADLLAQLRRPHACDDPKIFPPRPPLQFGTWLRTLRLRANLKR